MLVNPGEELLTETNSHIVRAELGAGAVFSGITTRTWLAPRGLLKADDALAIAKPDSGPYLVSTTAIAVENTHNFGGGTVQSIDEMKKLYAGASKFRNRASTSMVPNLECSRCIWCGFQRVRQVLETISVCCQKVWARPLDL
jgi:threonine aldolase